jgi:hypothetical protein
MPPPPPPPAFIDPNKFKTPTSANRAGPSQRRIISAQAKPISSPGFSNLQDSFSVDPDAEISRMSKRPKQSHMTASQTQAFGDEDDTHMEFSPPRGNENDFGSDFGPALKPPLGIEEPPDMFMEKSEADLRGEVRPSSET